MPAAPTLSAGPAPQLQDLHRSYRAPAFLLIAYLAVFPIYLSESGLPQMSSAVAVCLFIVVLARHRRLYVASNDLPVLSALAHFVIYAWLVSSVWAIVLMDPMALLPAAYFTFNAALLAAIHHLRWGLGARLHHVALAGVFVGLGWQMFYWVTPIGQSGYFGREIFLFNNPNQLGYYALLCGLIIAMPASSALASRWRVTGLVISALLVALSASSAAILSFAMLLPISMLAHRRNRIITLAALALILVGVLPGTQEAVMNRMERLGESPEDNLSGRGYDRLLYHPEHLIFGAGEHAQGQRFTSQLEMELHSSVATLLFSYGIVGTILFGRFVYRMCAGATGRSALYLLPIAFYGLAHQGLRFSMVWVAIALISTSRPRSSTGTEVTSNRLMFAP